MKKDWEKPSLPWRKLSESSSLRSENSFTGAQNTHAIKLSTELDRKKEDKFQFYLYPSLRFQNGSISSLSEGSNSIDGQATTDSQSTYSSRSSSLAFDIDIETGVRNFGKEGRYLLGFEGYGEYVDCRNTNIFKYSYYEVRYGLKSTIKSLGALVTGNASKDDVAGPIGIAQVIGEVSEAAAPY